MTKEYMTEWQNKRRLKNATSLEDLVKDISEVNKFQEFLYNNCTDKKGKINGMKVRAITSYGTGVFEQKCKVFFIKPENYELTLAQICGLIINNITAVPLCENCNINHKVFLGYVDKPFSITCSQECFFSQNSVACKNSHIKRVKYEIDNPELKIKRKQKLEATMLKKYGARNISKTQHFKDKYKATCQERFGEDSYLKSVNKGLKQEFYKKGCKTYFDKTGYTLSFKNPAVMQARAEKWLLKYGERNVGLVPEILDKAISNSFKWHKYKDTGIVYQGSYELYFLDLINEKGLLHTIENGPKIPYYMDNKKYLYLVDFKIKDTNRLIEIKSSYTYNKMGKDVLLQAKNDAKWLAARQESELIVLMGKKEIKNYVDTFL